MSTRREIARSLAGGVWRTGVVDEDTGGNGGSQPLEWTTKNISSAQLLALDTTSVELLPELTGRNYYVVETMVLHYRFVSAPYNENAQNTLTVGFGGTVSEIVNDSPLVLPLGLSAQVGDLFKKTEDFYIGPPITMVSPLGYIKAAANLEQKALGIALDPSFLTPLTGGDSTLTVRVLHTTIDGAP